MSRQQKLDELTKKLSETKEQRNKINAEAKELAEKRDKLNEGFKNLRMETLALRSERDGLNEKVKEMKRKRSETKTKIHLKIEEAKGLNQEIKALAKRKPSKSFHSLQKEVEDIDWKIQTMSPSLQEEKELVERVKQLENQLSVHRKLEQSSKKLFEVRAEIKALERESEGYHKELTVNAQESRAIHEKMLVKIEESKKLKTEADDTHKLFLEARGKMRPIQGEIDGIFRQIKLLEEEIRAEEQKEKKKKEDILREKLEKDAREKLRRGEKLAWEEFQLLGKEEETTRD